MPTLLKDSKWYLTSRVKGETKTLKPMKNVYKTRKYICSLFFGLIYHTLSVFGVMLLFLSDVLSQSISLSLSINEYRQFFEVKHLSKFSWNLFHKTMVNPFWYTCTIILYPLLEFPATFDEDVIFTLYNRGLISQAPRLPSLLYSICNWIT